MDAVNKKRGSVVTNKDHKTPGRDWRGKKPSTAAGDGGDGAAAAAAGGDKKFKFRNEDKPRSEACYVCGKDGHRAEACGVVADLQKKFNTFVQKQKNNEALTVKDHNALLWDCARAMEKRGAVYVFESISAQVFPKLKPNDDSFKALEHIHTKAAKDKSQVQGLPVPDVSPTLRIKAILDARKLVASQSSALEKVGPVIDYLKSHIGEAARCKNRFKLSTLIGAATEISRKECRSIVSLLYRGGVVADKKQEKIKTEPLSGDSKLDDKAALEAARKAEKAKREIFVFDFTKVKGLKDVPLMVAKEISEKEKQKKVTQPTTQSALKKKKMLEKKAKLKAELAADPVKAAAHKEAKMKKRAERAAREAEKKSGTPKADGAAKKKAKSPKPAAAAAAAGAAGDSKSAATNGAAAAAATAATGDKKKKKKKNKKPAAAAAAANGGAAPAAGAATAAATTAAAPAASKKRKATNTAVDAVSAESKSTAAAPQAASTPNTASATAAAAKKPKNNKKQKTAATAAAPAASTKPAAAAAAMDDD